MSIKCNWDNIDEFSLPSASKFIFSSTSCILSLYNLYSEKIEIMSIICNNSQFF